jgi:glycerol-3-phosphate acyltransferase PlsY
MSAFVFLSAILEISHCLVFEPPINTVFVLPVWWVSSLLLVFAIAAVYLGHITPIYLKLLILKTILVTGREGP